MIAQETQHNWGAGVHFLTNEVAVERVYRNQSVIIKAEDDGGGYNRVMIKSEDMMGLDDSDVMMMDDPRLHGEDEDQIPLAKHELLEYVIQHDGSVVCKWCGETLPSRTHWYRHKYRVHAVNLYKCTKCNMFFKTKKGYIGHISNRHGRGEDEVVEEEEVVQEVVVRCDLAEEPPVEMSPHRVEHPCNDEPTNARTTSAVGSHPRGSEWEEERLREERLVAEIIDRVRRECEAQGSATLSRRRYTRRSTVMNS